MITPSSGPGCDGRVGESTGPAAPLATLEITAPSRAASGATVAVNAQVVVRAEGPRVVTRPTTSELVVLEGDRVVSRVGGLPGPDVPLVLAAGRTRPAQVLPPSITLVTCDGAPLAPGSYAVRGVLGYGGDPLNNAPSGGAGDYALVSAIVPLTVT